METIVNNWKSIAVLVAIVGAFITGRYTVSARVEYVDRIKTVEVEKLVQGKDIHTVEYRDRVITKVVVRKPDGTTTETTTDKDGGHTTTDDHEVKTITVDKIVERETIRRIDTTPDWRVSVLAGYTATKWERIPSLGSEHLLLGVEVDRRILGPFSIGIFGLSSGAGGLSISGTF